MKKIVVFLALLPAMHAVYGQLTRSPLTARYTGIGVYSRHFADAFSGTINQAALAQLSQVTAGVYGERRFLLKELSNYAAAIAWPSKWGGVGISLKYFGGTDFNTSQIGLGYGKKLGDKIDIGVQFNENLIKIPGYGSSATIKFEAGVLLHLTDNLQVGVHVYNPAGGRFGKMNAEKLASVYTTGLGYEISDKVFISTAISKEENQPVQINAGMQYRFAEKFSARGGIATGAGNYFFGAGVQWKTYRLDAVTVWQWPLGFTPALMLLFNFHEDKTAAVIEE